MALIISLIISFMYLFQSALLAYKLTAGIMRLNNIEINQRTRKIIMAVGKYRVPPVRKASVPWTRRPPFGG